jgi:hypothetical protein
MLFEWDDYDSVGRRALSFIDGLRDMKNQSVTDTDFTFGH